MRSFLAVPRLLLLGSALTVLGFTPHSAQAATQFFTFLGTDQGLSVQISTDGSAHYSSATAGRFNGKLGNVAHTVFCTDVSHLIGTGSAFETLVNLGKITDAANILNAAHEFYEKTPGVGAGMASALEAGLTTVNGNSNTSVTDYLAISDSQSLGAAGAQARASEAAYLIDSYLNATAGTFSSGASGQTDLATNLGGVQLALWDIVQDGGDGILGAGNFRAKSFGTLSDTATSNLVNYYLNQAKAHSSYTGDAVWIQALRTVVLSDVPHDQDFTYTPHAAIPEPAFVQCSVFLILGGIGLRRLRKK